MVKVIVSVALWTHSPSFTRIFLTKAPSGAFILSTTGNMTILMSVYSASNLNATLNGR